MRRHTCAKRKPNWVIKHFTAANATSLITSGQTRHSRNQPTTPIQVSVTNSQIVTVIDPRHPLYQQTFRPLNLTNKSHLGPCLLAVDEAGHQFCLPLAVTDHSPEPLLIAVSPL